MVKDSHIIIIGAGAAGLMAARKLAKKGKKVTILEARNRIGGRIFPLSKKDFGYAAQGGAEFVHGKAPITKSIIKEAGLKFVETRGEIWAFQNGELKQVKDFVNQDQHVFIKRLKNLKKDMPIAQFFHKHLSEEKYAPLRKSLLGMIQGFDAADPKRMSIFSFRDEWLASEDEWQQGRIIKEGYGAMLDFLEAQCTKKGVEIRLNQKVKAIKFNKEGVVVHSVNGKIYKGQKAIVTVSIPLISSIKFIPAIPKKLIATKNIGFGGVVKFLFYFKDKWWTKVKGKDLRKVSFIRSQEIVPTWWTQYPESSSTLTGWLAGPNALKYRNASRTKLLQLGLTSLSNIFTLDKQTLKKRLINFEIINWPVDPFAKGAYSYPMLKTEDAIKELQKPVANRIFFAGEAICTGSETTTVEGALKSGLEVAAKIT